MAARAARFLRTACSTMTSERMKVLALLAGVAIVLLIVCLAGFVVVAGRDFNESLGPLIGYATPTVITLFTFAGIQEKLDKVHKQVNGNYDALARQNEDLTYKFVNLAEGGETKSADQHDH
ncbi:hypothetical protein Toil_gp17 [Rhodococcus phage Toil]|uniref:Holin n=1 Tax=Rhodococcus phage Toil TaxID=1975614 RepID=A0A1W6DXH1_9VIRU|nr:hypothetical protein KMD62_gp17 [Rhodococcus phage Toil]ARK07700.1 hypothetical protein Toil_gp17 [Rhodococcus phage Toil]